ncbi:GNAT family N-acetyltransferase [Deltaproteobacteria bacterium OttesenSCG-928-M10]|nr:GNAT family N-acetyltransferase [Deltaproteobacteria bacterium OttesenSCG-928-M10]
MRHDYYLSGRSFALRPVDDRDIETIIALRSDPDRTRFLPPVSGRRQDQQAWLESYYQRPGDYYFAVTNKNDTIGDPLGFVSVYDVEAETGLAQWGRVILKRGSGAFPETVYLSYQFAFEMLAMQCLYIRTVSANEKLLDFHDKCGLRRHAVLAGALAMNNQSYNLVEHRLSAKNWPAVKSFLNGLITA